MIQWEYILFCLLLPFGTLAQKDTHYFKRFTIEDGLPSPYINVLYEDNHNRLWIGTNAGLVSFDGYNFHQYSVQDGLESEVVYDIIEDTEGSLWIAGNKGVHILKRDSFISLHWNSSTPHIELDTMGNIWLSNNWGLYYYTKEEIADSHRQEWKNKLTPRKIEAEKPNNVFSLKADDKGNLFVSEGTGIYQINHHQEVEKLYTHTVKDEYITRLLPLPGDSLFWCTKEGSVYLTTKEKTIPIHLTDPDNYPGAKALNKWDQRITLLTDFSLLSFAPNVVDELNFPEEWAIKQLRCILPDEKGNLWVGTSEGLILATPRLFHQKDYPHSEIYSLHETDSTILIGANHAEVYRYEQQKEFIKYPSKNVLPNGEIMDIMTDFNGGVWFVSYWRGVSRWYKNQIQRFFYSYFSEEEPDLNCILQSPDSTVWLGGEGLLFKIKMDWKKEEPLFIKKLPLEKGTCYKLFLDKMGLVWAGTSEGLYSAKGDSINPVAIDGLPPNIGIKDARWIAGDLWLATQGFGIVICKRSGNGNIQLSKILSVNEGLINNYVECIEKDGTGNIWAGTLVGLSRINPNNNYIIHNYAQDGLTEKPYFNITLLKDTNNLMWCATSYGLFSFDPSDFTILNKEVNSHFAQVLVNGERQVRYEEKKFNYTQNSFQFNFLHINTTHADLIRYSYRLKGLDANWSTPSGTREVKFDYLPPGDYQFEVKTGNAQGEWSSNLLKYTFKISPPFWQTAWFSTLSFLLIFLGLFVYIKRREIEIRRKEKEKSRFYQLIAELESRALRAQMNPHFIFNSMNAIQEQILLYETDSAYNYLSKFAHLMRMILNSSATHEIKISDEVQLLNLYLELESLRFEESFKFSISHEEDIAFLMIPGLMVQPFVENAIWHGLMHKKTDRTLEVIFKTDENHIICMVKDNGIGRSEAKKIKALLPKAHQSQALRLIHDRLDLINSRSPIKAKLKITDLMNENGLPKGTLIELFIPINWQIYWSNEKNKKN